MPVACIGVGRCVAEGFEANLSFALSVACALDGGWWVNICFVAVVLWLLLLIVRRYIGMEYIRTNNIAVSEKFLQQAETICPSDPLVLNELGVVVSVVWFTFEWLCRVHVKSQASTMVDRT